jgi:SWI/SNF-related matrix-associated actin-dependent regulator 1 of chromatin subfamily A
LTSTPAISITFTGGRFICVAAKDSFATLRDAGFVRDKEAKTWYTRDSRVVGRLREFCDKAAEKALSRRFITVTPWTARLSHPPERKPRPFQIPAALFALERNRSYIGAEPGLGKTIIAALTAGAYGGRALYICPPFMVLTAFDEFSKWTSHIPGYEVVIGSRTAPDMRKGVWIVPDSLIHRKEILKEIEKYAFRSPKKILFYDEIHRCKSKGAKRSKALYQSILPIYIHKAVFMSGTPMPNRPIELYPLLSRAAGETINFASEIQFGKKYCDAFYDGYGWNLKGANLPALKKLGRRLRRKFMLRLYKKDVMKELPPKIEELLIIGDKLPAQITKIEKQILRHHSPEDLVGAKFGVIGDPNDPDEVPLATYRRMLGDYKVKEAVKAIRGILEDTTDSILIFAIHKGTIKKLSKALDDFSPLVVTGQTPMPERHQAVKTFQTGKNRRVFIGNIQAAGTGFTLTKARQVLFVEFSWTPGDNDQASDRPHRIGQTGTVYVRYLVYANSLDRKVLEVNLRKREAIDLI